MTKLEFCTTGPEVDNAWWIWMAPLLRKTLNRHRAKKKHTFRSRFLCEELIEQKSQLQNFCVSTLQLLKQEYSFLDKCVFNKKNWEHLSDFVDSFCNVLVSTVLLWGQLTKRTFCKQFHIEYQYTVIPIIKINSRFRLQWQCCLLRSTQTERQRMR